MSKKLKRVADGDSLETRSGYKCN